MVGPAITIVYRCQPSDVIRNIKLFLIRIPSIVLLAGVWSEVLANRFDPKLYSMGICCAKMVTEKRKTKYVTNFFSINSLPSFELKRHLFFRRGLSPEIQISKFR